MTTALFTQNRDHVARRVRVALGQSPGDLLLYGGTIANIFTGELIKADAVISDGVIAGVGLYDWEAAEREDVTGLVLIPGLIDAHLHVESTLLTPGELARLVVPHGTSAVVADPHEIGNVLGADGVRDLVNVSCGLPMDFLYMAPSCVPAVDWDAGGAVLGADEVDTLLNLPGIYGLAEMMNFPGVLGANPEVIDKLVRAWNRGMCLDGHAPGLLGRDLTAYASTGIRSDHESTFGEEALQKARLGMMVQVREGSGERNMEALLPLLAAGRLGEWSLATDDMHPDDLVRDGHLDHRLRQLTAGGVDPIQAVRHASYVPARHYGLRDRGAVAPGYRADVVAVEDLRNFRVKLVLHGGKVVARDGVLTATIPARSLTPANTMRVPDLAPEQLWKTLAAGTHPVIGLVENQIVTETRSARYDPTWDHFLDDAGQPTDVVRAACIERHRGTGRIGLGLVNGLNLVRGAIGSSVAHDAHNLILAGVNAEDMALCARTLQTQGGGFVVCDEGRVLAALPLPWAGLMSVEPYERVCEQLAEVNRAARALGCGLHSPFGTFSFIALPVIPELRLTSHGLFSVSQQKFL